MLASASAGDADKESAGSKKDKDKGSAKKDKGGSGKDEDGEGGKDEDGKEDAANGGGDKDAEAAAEGGKEGESGEGKDKEKEKEDKPLPKPARKFLAIQKRGNAKAYFDEVRNDLEITWCIRIASRTTASNGHDHGLRRGAREGGRARQGGREGAGPRARQVRRWTSERRADDDDGYC